MKFTPRKIRYVAAAGVAAAMTFGGAQVATTAAAPSPGGINPSFERTVGGPGHAGLYAWGLATMNDGTVLVGDYWNYRVKRYNANGTPVGNGVFIDNSGNGATQYYTPYGLGIDPRNGNVFMADTDKYQIDVYSAAGKYLRSWGGHGDGVGKYLYPSRVVVNNLGKAFVADTWDNRVVMTTDTGTELGSFGGFGTKDGQLKSPHGLALDSANNVYVVDTGNWRVQVFNSSGQFLRKWGSKGSQNGQFQGDMRGIAIDKAHGWVYVVDGEANRVNKYDLNGKFLTRWGSQGYGNGQFADGGREITVDKAGNVWVADMPNFRVQKFSPTGQFIAAYPTPPQPPKLGGFNAPRGVAVAADGTIAVSDTYNWRIQTLTNTGTPIKAWGRRGRGPSLFNYARMLAFNPQNNDIIVTDTDNGQIHAYTKSGTFKWSSGTTGGANGQFKNPQSVAVGSNGLIYVADSNNKRVQVLNSSGQFQRVIGSAAQFTYPKGVTVDADGSIWVADSARSKVTHWSATGTLLTTLPIKRGTGDSQITAPFGIAVDSQRVYLADVPTHSVKVFNKVGGAFVTKIGSRGSANGKLLQPAEITIAGGKLYVAEEGNDRISVFRLNAS